MRNYKVFFNTIFFLFVSFLNAQVEKKSDSVNKLQEVVVRAIIKDKKLKEVTENIQILSSKEIAKNDGLQYSTILNKVPGIFMQNGSLNTNRITIRGIGARSPFSTTGIRAYFGEIPLTDGNGVSAIEDIDLTSISSIEIHKGPSASSFGVGLGGVIILNPDISFSKGTRFSAESVYGSFGLLKSTANFNYSKDNFNTNIIYSNTHSDGFRDNNEYDRQSFTATTAVKISKKNKIQFIGNYTDLKAFIPSSVNLETYNENPESVAFIWGRSQGFEDFQSFLGGLSWQHDFSSALQVNSSIFITDKENYEPSPFNILSEDINGFGVRSRISKNSKKMKWGIGAELFYDTNRYSTFENLYEDFPSGTGSVKGVELSNYKELRNYVNVFGEFAYKFYQKWEFNVGFNLNKTNYKIEDNFNTDEENQSNDYEFDAIVSPKFGVLYTLNDNVNIKASVAHGFVAPTTEETLLPDGLINTDLEPEKGWNYELGTNFSFLNNRLNGDMSVYTLEVTDLLVDRRAENDALFAINAGKTNHFGIEGNFNYMFLKSDKVTLDGFVNGSIYKYSFDTFIDNENDYSGNTLTGMPSEVFNAGFSITSELGFYGNINFQHVGSMYADDANTGKTEAYQLTNIKIGYKTTLRKKLSIHAFFGVNNLLNTKYVSQLQVNASSFGGSAPRYYYAGNPVNFYSGVKVEYLF